MINFLQNKLNMKKLKITIAGEVKTFDLPENGDYKVEIVDKYMPKVGDCVMKSGNDLERATFFKIEYIDNDGDLRAYSSVDLDKGKYTINLLNFLFLYETEFTQITPEELKAKYAEAGYDWDYDTDTIKPLKWMPKVGDIVWYLLDDFTIVDGFYNENLYYLLEKDLLFKTVEECKEFSDHCLKYFDKK